MATCSFLAIIILPISSIERNSFRVRTMYSVSPSFIFPPARLMFSSFNLLVISPNFIFVIASFFSSSLIRISFSNPPLTFAAATPLMLSNSRAISSSTISLKSISGISFAEMPIRITGSRDGSYLSIIGLSTALSR